MYSIIIKLKTSDSCCSMNTSNSLAKDRWKYLTNSDGSIYKEDDVEKVKQKCLELLDTYPLSSIKVVQNKDARADIYVEGAPDPHVSILPEVTVDDNGKVLMVVDGDWAAAEEAGTEVSITPALSTGTKIADYTIDGVDSALYGPGVFTGATTTSTGTEGLVPAQPQIEQGNIQFLQSDGTWGTHFKYADSSMKKMGEANFYYDENGDAIFVDTWDLLESRTFEVDKNGIKGVISSNENYELQRSLPPTLQELDMGIESLSFNINTEDAYTKSLYNMKQNETESEINIYPSDIHLSRTWDGTHEFLTDAIAAASGGAGLPAVTSADNGKILKVVEGSWSKGTDDGNIVKGGVYGIGTDIFESSSPFYDNKIYILMPKDKWNDNITNFSVQNQIRVNSGTIAIETHPNEYFWQLSTHYVAPLVGEDYYISVFASNGNINAQTLSTQGKGTMQHYLLSAIKEQYTIIGITTTYQLTSTVITSQQVQNMWDNIFNPTEEEVNNE